MSLISVNNVSKQSRLVCKIKLTKNPCCCSMRFQHNYEIQGIKYPQTQIAQAYYQRYYLQFNKHKSACFYLIASQKLQTHCWYCHPKQTESIRRLQPTCPGITAGWGNIQTVFPCELGVACASAVLYRSRHCEAQHVEGCYIPMQRLNV